MIVMIVMIVGSERNTICYIVAFDFRSDLNLGTLTIDNLDYFGI
jgi:hypothetical protein